ncbi:MAG: hypothetical protein CMN67_03295 [Sphingomonadaceae bacterium]|nr:hypothetical protein [Sphingomonadaceae bacterium]MBG75771.1 hypothetical protein [Erythrobacteraceae bacterium]
MKTRFAFLALLPASFGPVPVAAQTIETRLCGGGVLSIPIPMRESPPTAPCHSEGCHASCSRKRIGPAQ